MKKQTDTTHKDCMKIWFDWYVEKTGITPKIDGSQGMALKQIITYFKTTYPDYTPQQCLKALLINWDKLTPFNQKFKEIRAINSQLTNLLEDIYNGKSNSKNQQLSNKLADENNRIKSTGTAFD